jgi:hypothetical protein
MWVSVLHCIGKYIVKPGKVMESLLKVPSAKDHPSHFGHVQKGSHASIGYISRSNAVFDRMPSQKSPRSAGIDPWTGKKRKPQY